LFSLGFVGEHRCARLGTVPPVSTSAASRRHSTKKLARIATESVSDDELERARALIESDELGALSRCRGRADRLSMYATLFERPDLITGCCRATLAVTADEQARATVFRA